MYTLIFLHICRLYADPEDMCMHTLIFLHNCIRRTDGGYICEMMCASARLYSSPQETDSVERRRPHIKIPIKILWILYLPERSTFKWSGSIALSLRPCPDMVYIWPEKMTGPMKCARDAEMYFVCTLLRVRSISIRILWRIEGSEKWALGADFRRCRRISEGIREGS